MMVLVGVAERGAPGLLTELDRLLPLRGRRLLLVHVIDDGARGGLEGPRGRLVPRPLPPHRRRAIGEVERRVAEAALQEAVATATHLGAEIETLVGEGEPGRVLARLAGERGAELVALAARSDRRAGESGPHSVGRTARFVVDHAPRPVLLLRGA